MSEGGHATPSLPGGNLDGAGEWTIQAAHTFNINPEALFGVPIMKVLVTEI